VVCVGLIASNGAHRYTLIFETAGQLVPGNQVLIGGEPVGSVKSIDLTEDERAAIEIEVEQKLHEGTSAVIRATGLAGVANYYVALTPGPNNEPELEDGATIGTDHTTAPVHLDEVLNAFTKEARGGLRDFVQGQAAIFENRGPEARETYKYFAPALFQTKRFVDELNGDQRLFERFLASSAKIFTTLADREDELSNAVSNSRVALEAVASENEALDRTLERLAPTFRRSNTTFVNLRYALDDLDSLVDTAMPTTENLEQFLDELLPFLRESRPFVRNLRLALRRDGKDNDLGELTELMPKVGKRARPAFRRARRAIKDFQPVLDFARPYSVDMVQSLVKLGASMANYDAGGHYARSNLMGLNFFERNGLGQLQAIPESDQYAPFGPDRITRRCPGAGTQRAADNSNPFVAPLWPESGLAASDCNAGEVPPGP
jgi:phospholipid/cholesterol/gamma-HCH transport system substrate-binding protein